MTHRKLIEQMLDCIEELRYCSTTFSADKKCAGVIPAAHEYLAQPEQSEEPHAWLHDEHQGWVVRMPPPDTGEGRWYPVYTHPAQTLRELTEPSKDAMEQDLLETSAALAEAHQEINALRAEHETMKLIEKQLSETLEISTAGNLRNEKLLAVLQKIAANKGNGDYDGNIARVALAAQPEQRELSVRQVQDLWTDCNQDIHAFARAVLAAARSSK